MSFTPKFTVTAPILADIAEIERARGFLQGANLPASWLKNLRREATFSEAHHTTHIEGTQLNFAQTKKILSGRKVSDADQDDVQEVKNYRDALRVKNNHLAKGRIIDEDFIKNIHRELVKEVRENQAQPGLYRLVQNYIWSEREQRVVYTPPPFEDVPKMMREFVDWINSESQIHPVIKSGIIQFQFVYIHPFVDGNGRVSRLLCSFHLDKTGYDFKKLFSISEYYDEDREKFYSAIRSVKKNNLDLSYWLEYFVAGILAQLTITMASVKHLTNKEHIVRSHNLSANHAVILDHLLAEGHLQSENFPALCRQIGRLRKTNSAPISIRSLQRYLRELVDKKILCFKGVTNNRKYYLNDRLVT